MITIFDRETINNRQFTIYEIDNGKRRQWEVWERTGVGRGTRVYGPGSKKGCYDFLANIRYFAPAG